MNPDFAAFDDLHLLGENAIYAQADRPSGTHPLARRVVPHKGTPIHYGLKPVWSRMRLPLYPQGVGRGCKDAKASTTTLYPQGVGRIRKAAEAATTPLSLLVAPQGDSFQYPLEGYSDPLRAKARVESYASPGLPPRRFAAVSGVVGGFAALRIRRPPCGGTRPNAPSGASNCGF